MKIEEFAQEENIPEGYTEKWKIDSTDLDKTYIYPGDPAPEGMKWVLVEDDSPGVIAYVEPDEG